MLISSSSLSLTPLATQSFQTRSSKMRNSREGSSSSLYHQQAIDLFEQVKEAHGLGPQDLCKLLKDTESVSFMYNTENGSFLKIDVEKLIRLLPLHLIAVVLNSERNKVLLAYLLCGLRLLHSICEASSRLPKIEQIFMEDVKISEQVIDLVFYLLTVFSNLRETVVSGDLLLLYSTVVACSMHLLAPCISTHWNELACLLSSHPKVDVFMDASFRSVYINVSSLQIRILAPKNECPEDSSLFSEPSATHLCLQCEASLQFLQLLCQQKPFRERLLRNKELCGKGGILRLTMTILKLDIPTLYDESPPIVAAIYRLKSKALSILLLLCETNNGTFLDEVAGIPGSLSLAKSVVCEVISLLKSMAGKGCKQQVGPSGKVYPTGILQLNALRLADVFSDDSNFRSYITAYFAEVLAVILSLPYQEFLSSWCSSDPPSKEVDATLNYDPFTAAGWIINSLSSHTMKNIIDSLSLNMESIVDSLSSLDIKKVEYLEISFQPSNIPQASYAHLRTSLLVKIIANLHCFVAKFCEEQERNFFLNKFLESLRMQFPDSGTGFAFVADSHMAATVGKNIRALLGHTESLIPAYLSGEDMHIFRVFFKQLKSIIGPRDSEVNRAQEDQYARGYSYTPPGNVNPDHKSRNGNLREEMSENSAFLVTDRSYVLSDPVDEADITDDRRFCSGRFSHVAPRCVSMEIDKDIHDVETSGSDSSSNRGKVPVDREGNRENPKARELLEEVIVRSGQEERVEIVHCDEKQRRKRKRTIMNDEQVSMIEKALLEEPDMQKNAASLKAWAERLGSYGSEVTCSQLKNWLNNRKARLARIAKENRQWPEADTSIQVNESTSGAGHASEPPKGHPNYEPHVEAASKGKTPQSEAYAVSPRATIVQPHEIITIEDSPPTRTQAVQCSTSNSVQLEAGQFVLLLDELGIQRARAKVHQARDKWDGISLEETGTCVVDIIEYFPEKFLGVMHPRGASFNDNDVTIGRRRVLWESNKILIL